MLDFVLTSDDDCTMSCDCVEYFIRNDYYKIYSFLMLIGRLIAKCNWTEIFRYILNTFAYCVIEDLDKARCVELLTFTLVQHY